MRDDVVESSLFQFEEDARPNPGGLRGDGRM